MFKMEEMQKCKDSSEVFPVIHHTDYSLLKNDKGYQSPLPGTIGLDQGNTNVNSYVDRWDHNGCNGVPKMPDIVPFVVRRIKSDSSCSDISLSPKSPTISNTTKISSIIKPSLTSNHPKTKFNEDRGDMNPFVLLPPFNSISPQNRK
jgi:hypothetical protein